MKDTPKKKEKKRTGGSSLVICSCICPFALQPTFIIIIIIVRKLMSPTGLGEGSPSVQIEQHTQYISHSLIPLSLALCNYK